jgi:hypothetical protein
MPVNQADIFAGNKGGMDGSKTNVYGFKPQPITSNDPMSNFLHSMQNLGVAQGQQNLQTGGATTAQGLGAMAPVLNYLTALTRGDQGDVTQSMQPEINRIKDSFSAARQMISQAPRGGGKAGVLAEAPYQETKQIGDLAAQARQGATGQLGTLANQLAGLGLDISNLGLNQEQLSQTGALTQRQQNVMETMARDQMIGQLAQAAGSIASAGLTGGMPTGGGMPKAPDLSMSGVIPGVGLPADVGQFGQLPTASAYDYLTSGVGQLPTPQPYTG